MDVLPPSKGIGITYSTLSTMLHKTTAPSVPTLVKLCEGFGITLAQFFTLEDETAKLTQNQLECLAHWNRLDDKSKPLAVAYMRGIADRQDTP